MTRIIAGAARGRRLAVPPAGTRPTSDRVREALFSSLDHEFAGWSQVRVIDLFAGSGALGLEALSRGAQSAVLVERAAPALDVIRRNVATVGLAGAEVVRADVMRLVQSPPAGAPADLVFLDPPYDIATAVVIDVLSGLADNGWLASNALVVVERSTADPLTWASGYEAVRERVYGDTTLWLGRGQ